VVAAAVVAFLRERLEIGQDAMRTAAERDPLTGVGNYRTLYERLDYEIARHGRHNRRFALALLDLNDFKQVNDNAGHATGDQVLRQTVELWSTRLREGDRLARLGGDEFAVLLRGTGAFAAQSIAERLKVQLPHAPGSAAGVASWRPDDDAASLTRRADEQLYADKVQGAARSRDARA
jgi:diguanylate cyclase (GGDEF)-like protein